MKEIINNIHITGVLVSNNIEEFKTNAGVEAIGGSLILRTSDDSEHEINFYSNKYKKDENGKFTNEENYFYRKYLEAKDNLKDMKSCVENESPSVISINDGCFTANDFKDKSSGNVISTNRISARFINIVDSKNVDSTPQESKFEVEGIIESITDEVRQNELTGNLVILINTIAQRNINGKYGKDAIYEADTLIPIKLIVDKSIVEAFRAGGYYDGCWAKFVGKLVNTTVTESVVEKQAFGEDNVKTFTRIDRKYLVKSGSAPSTFFEHELSQEQVDALISKRKQHIAEVKSGVKKDDAIPFDESNAVSNSNPFAKANMNPFAK